MTNSDAEWAAHVCIRAEMPNVVRLKIRSRQVQDAPEPGWVEDPFTGRIQRQRERSWWDGFQERLGR